MFKTEINRSIWMNKIRSRLLHHFNIIKHQFHHQCYNLFAIEDDINDRLLKDNDDIDI